MRRTEKIRYRDKDFWVDKFDSIDEFFQVCLAQPTHEMNERSRSGVRTLGHEEAISFRGLTIAQIREYKYGYPEGVEALKLLPELNIKKGGVKYAHKWDDTDGDDMSMERYYEGMACMRKRYKTTGENQAGRFVEIKVNITENAGVSYQAMLWKTYVACRLVDQLEDQGVRVKLTISLRVDVYWSSWNKLVVDVTVKDFSHPLNISLLANACSPWFFRYWCFYYMAKTNNMTALGYGQARGFSNLGWRDDENLGDKKDLIMIDCGQCLSQDSAERFIKALEI